VFHDRKHHTIKTQKLFSAVKKAIDEWNPYLLLPDAPEDEFDIESCMIALRINENSSVEEITAVVSSVFSKQFEPEYFQAKDCVEVAQAIKSNIKNFVENKYFQY